MEGNTDEGKGMEVTEMNGSERNVTEMKGIEMSVTKMEESGGMQQR